MGQGDHGGPGARVPNRVSLAATARSPADLSNSHMDVKKIKIIACLT